MREHLTKRLAALKAMKLTAPPTPLDRTITPETAERIADILVEAGGEELLETVIAARMKELEMEE